MATSGELGGVLLIRIIHTGINTNISTDITDALSFSINKSTSIQNNIFELLVKNAPVLLRSDGVVYATHITSSGLVEFNEKDVLKVYLKYTDDGADIGSTAWATSSHLVGSFVVEEYSATTTENNTHLSLRCVDMAFLLFNIVFTYTYGTGNTFTAPGIFRNMVRLNSEKLGNLIETFDGTDNDAGVEYAIDTKFESEGGGIKDYRTVADGGPTTQLNGALNDSATTITVDSTTGFIATNGTIVLGTGTSTEHIYYTGVTATEFTGCTRAIDDTTAKSHSDNADVFQGFPAVTITKSWKPMYEWASDIGQSIYTNYLTEIAPGATPFFSRAFMLMIDENNKIYWFYPNDDVDLTINLGDDELRGFKLDKSVFDSINFVIYNAGEDMDGHGILYYWFDQNTNTSSMKMRYQPMTDIVYQFVQDDIANFNTTRDTSSTQDKLKQYPSSYSPAISNWSFKAASNNFRSLQGQAARTTLTSNAEYNESLREACKWAGLQEAQRITAKMSGLRWRGTIALKGVIVNPGDLIQTTNQFGGTVNQLLRVVSVRHSVTQGNGWESILELEEDEKVV